MEENKIEEVQNNEPVTLNVKPPKKSKKGLIITIIILVLLAVGGLTTWLIISNNNSDSDEPDIEEKDNKKDKKEDKKKDQEEIVPEEKDDENTYLYFYKNKKRNELVTGELKEDVNSQYNEDDYELYDSFKCENDDCYFKNVVVYKDYSIIYDGGYYLYNVVSKNKYKLDLADEIDVMAYDDIRDCVVYRKKDDKYDYCFDYKTNLLRDKYYYTLNCRRYLDDHKTMESYRFYTDIDENIIDYYNTSEDNKNIIELDNYKNYKDAKNYLLSQGFQCDSSSGIIK